MFRFTCIHQTFRLYIRVQLFYTLSFSSHSSEVITLLSWRRLLQGRPAPLTGLSSESQPGMALIWPSSSKLLLHTCLQSKTNHSHQHHSPHPHWAPDQPHEKMEIYEQTRRVRQSCYPVQGLVAGKPRLNRSGGCLWYERPYDVTTTRQSKISVMWWPVCGLVKNGSGGFGGWPHKTPTHWVTTLLCGTVYVYELVITLSTEQLKSSRMWKNHYKRRKYNLKATVFIVFLWEWVRLR